MEHELSDFTKLVLARLETNPDEFQLGGRWDTLVRGLEAYAIDETENRYHRTLWPLTDHERTTILEAYRKAYLARLHKDMLKNIVSGNDLGPSPEQTYQAGLGKSNQVLTTSAMKQQTLGLIQKEFNEAYNDAFSNAIVKGEGQTVMPDSNTAYTYKATNRYVLNKSQLAVSKKLGMDPGEYARQLEKYGT